LLTVSSAFTFAASDADATTVHSPVVTVAVLPPGATLVHAGPERCRADARVS
jgi:hypothetical protein